MNASPTQPAGETPEAASVAPPAPRRPGPTTAATVDPAAALRSARRLTVLICVATVVLAPAVLAAARWPLWWTDIAPEQTPMTWLQSVVLVIAGVVAALLAFTDRIRVPGTGHRTWLMLAVGLFLLAIDERFAIHERVRDGYLAPRGVTVPFLPWVAPGDFLILTVGVCGLAVLPFVLRVVRSDRGAFRAFLVGVAMAVVAVGMDSIDPATWSVAQERVQQSAEECVELASGLALLCAVLLSILSRLGTCPAATPRAASSPTPDRATPA